MSQLGVLAICFLTLSTMVSCSENFSFESKQGKVSDFADSKAKVLVNKPADEGMPDTQEQELESDDDDREEITAIPPTIISGSYLTCKVVNIDRNAKTISISCIIVNESTVESYSSLSNGVFQAKDQAGSDLFISVELFEDGGFVVEAMLPETDLVVSTELSTVSQQSDDNLSETLVLTDTIATEEWENIDSLAKDEVVVESSSEAAEAPKVDFCQAILVRGEWITVPGDADYETSDFCVMKYEAFSDPAISTITSPIVNVSQEEAKESCSMLGEGFHLLTNEEWMTIGANISGQGINWTEGTVGAGSLITGHTDQNPYLLCPPDIDDTYAYIEDDCVGKDLASGIDDKLQRRTHYLSNGEVIWDIGGNAGEWVDYFTLDKPAPISNFSRELKEVTGGSLPIERVIPIGKSFWDAEWGSEQNIGLYGSGLQGIGGALYRGGIYLNGNRIGGVFYTNLMIAPSLPVRSVGFRCAKQVE